MTQVRDEAIGQVIVEKKPESSQVTDSKIGETELRTAGQRRINLMWEVTQLLLAISVCWTALFVTAFVIIKAVDIIAPELVMAGFVFLTGIANLVIGFYFGRTNHSRVGDNEDFITTR